MKRIFIATLVVLLSNSVNVHAQWYKNLFGSGSTTTTNSSSSSSSKTISGLTNALASDGIKEALVKGVTMGVTALSAKDGYYANPLVKIAFPEELQRVDKALRAAGLGSMADKGIQLLNRAAEDAASSATDIFVSAITDMTITDAVNIVAGGNTAGTEYLKNHTTSKLAESFNPIIEKSLGKVNAPKYWNTLITKYNSLPLVTKQVEPDLTKYVTSKAIDGMFVKISEQEKAIRENPLERTSDVLESVFK